VKFDLGVALLPPAAALFLKSLHATLRIRHAFVERITTLNESGTPYVLSFWHAHLLLMFYCRHRKPITMMSSQHRDGEMMMRTMRWFDVGCIRGSTTRGGSQALRNMIKVVQRGGNVGYTPDGPKGPVNVVQPGVIVTAQMTGAPILPLAFNAEKKTLLGSWDRMIVPHPFSRAIFVYGEPIHVPRDLTPEELEEYRLLLGTRMNELAAMSEAQFDELYASSKA
jgi:lysophospholipid acyltransferase (LPLAT)-like uncharacterized protein